MTLNILLFAGLRDLAGSSTVAVELPTNATVAELRQQLAAVHPQLAVLLARSRVAMNMEFAVDDSLIPHGAEIAVIPPVSGG